MADLRGRRQLRGFGAAAISEDDFTEFLVKTQRDELLLRMRHPQIAAVIRLGGVPPAVLQNYVIARDELEARIKFVVGLYTKYAPEGSKPTTAPVPLPTFEPKSQGLQGFGGIGLVTSQDVRVISVKAPSMELPVPAGLGNPNLMLWGIVIAGTLLAGVVTHFVINALNETEAKLAHEAVEYKKQENFARVWDTATKVLSQCIGTNPTPDRVLRCWADVADRFPDIVAVIPEHKPAPYGTGTGGFLKTVGIIAVVGVLGIIGLKVYQRSQASSRED
jgi:hypothetical protein